MVAPDDFMIFLELHFYLVLLRGAETCFCISRIKPEYHVFTNKKLLRNLRVASKINYINLIKNNHFGKPLTSSQFNCNNEK